MKIDRLSASCMLAFLFSGCHGGSGAANQGPPPPTQITSKPTGEGIINIDLQESNSEMQVGMQNVPADTQLSCTLNGTQLADCHDQMRFAFQDNGAYVFSVVAKRGEQVVAYGEGRFQKGRAAAEALATARDDANSNHPLALLPDDNSFNNGMAIKVGEPWTFKFKLRNDPKCEPSYECSYDARNNSMWRACDSKNSETIPKGVMARGLQYLKVQAHCGDQVGPTLQVFWYGVDEDYTRLALNGITVGKNKLRQFVLTKASVCPVGMLAFECSSNSNEAYKACKNSQKSVPSGFRIRAVCNGKAGPTHVVL